MSEAIHFDTHKFVKRMTETGMSEATAEALADEQLRLIQGELATKRDLEEFRAATKHDIEEFRAATKHDIEEFRAATKRDLAELDKDFRHAIAQVEAGLRLEIEQCKSGLIRWMAGLLIAQGGVIIAILRLFPA